MYVKWSLEVDGLPETDQGVELYIQSVAFYHKSSSFGSLAESSNISSSVIDECLYFLSVFVLCSTP